MCGRCAAFGGTDLKDQEEGGIRADDRSTLLAKCRVTKSENFPDKVGKSRQFSDYPDTFSRLTGHF